MRIRDPALFTFTFFDRHLPGHREHDPRLVLRDLFSGLETAYELSDSDPEWEVDTIEELNFVDLDRVDDGFTRWIDRFREGPGKELREVKAYTFGDAVYLHALESRSGRAMDFGAAWEKLTGAVRPILGACDWSSVGERFWGLNLYFSVLLPEATYRRLTPDTVRAELRSISKEEPLVTHTRFGQLWLTGSDWLDLDVEPDLKATWVMISPRSSEMEVELQALAHDTDGPKPPELPLLLNARQKFHVQSAIYEGDHQRLRWAREKLDKRIDWMIEAQRDYEDLSRVTDSAEAEELRQKTSHAHTNVAAFERAVSLVQEAVHTLEINQGNYEKGTAGLLGEGADDEIFRPELGYMEERVKQIESNASYHARLLERFRALLDAAQARFNISQDRGQAREVTLGTAQVSGLFASLMALLITDILNLTEVAQRRPLLATTLLLLGLLGSLAVAQVVLAWGRIKSRLTSFSLAGTGGLLAILPLSQNRDGGPWHWLSVGTAFLAGFGVVYGIVRLLEERPRKDTVPLWRQVRGFTSQVEKLRDANAELEDLLDDLPPTRYYRRKKDDSYWKKIEEKNIERAEELGITVDELKARGLEYTERDVGDPIGIRYIVAPWELPVVVDRVERALGGKTKDGGKVEKVEHKSGFGYKSVHIDIDLWGVGAKKDLNLMAEVQVRTYVQHLHASLIHDVIYKDVSRNPVRRLLAYVFFVPLALLSSLELLVFRQWMRWPKGEKGR